MPIFDYVCAKGCFMESIRAGYDDEIIDCPECGNPAARVAVNANQFVITETGAKDCRKVPFDQVPRDEKKINLSLFQEACAERDYGHRKMEEHAQRTLPARSLWREAKAKANAILQGKAPKPKFKYIKE